MFTVVPVDLLRRSLAHNPLASSKYAEDHAIRSKRTSSESLFVLFCTPTSLHQIFDESPLDFRVSSSGYEKWLRSPCLIRSNEKWRSILSELHAEEMSFLLFVCNSAVFFERFSIQYVLYNTYDVYIKVSYVRCSNTSVRDCILNRIKNRKHKWLKGNDESAALRF